MGDWVLVPREPSAEMKLAGGMIPDAFKGTVAAQGNAARVFGSMLASAPSPLEDEALAERLADIIIPHCYNSGDARRAARAILAALGR